VTVAVCIRCGAIKRGALTPCPECGFEPREKEEKAQSMVLIDRFLSKEDLSAISERIKSGQPVSYPGELMQGFADALEDNLDEVKLSTPVKVGCSLGAAAILVILAGVIWVLVRAIL
jgi:hypothetical protein